MTARGFCAVGIWHTKTETNVGTLFRTAHALDVNFVFTVGRRYKRQSSDTTKAWKSIPLFHFTSMDDLKSHLPYDCLLTGVELCEDAESVAAFAHPERCCYLLGAEDDGLGSTELAQCHKVVQLPGRMCLNVATAGAMVLYDRWMKSRSAKIMKTLIARVA